MLEDLTIKELRDIVAALSQGRWVKAGKQKAFVKAELLWIVRKGYNKAFPEKKERVHHLLDRMGKDWSRDWFNYPAKKQRREYPSIPRCRFLA